MSDRPTERPILTVMETDLFTFEGLVFEVLSVKGGKVKIGLDFRNGTDPQVDHAFRCPDVFHISRPSRTPAA